MTSSNNIQDSKLQGAALLKDRSFDSPVDNVDKGGDNRHFGDSFASGESCCSRTVSIIGSFQDTCGYYHSASFSTLSPPIRMRNIRNGTDSSSPTVEDIESIIIAMEERTVKLMNHPPFPCFPSKTKTKKNLVFHYFSD